MPAVKTIDDIVFDYITAEEAAFKTTPITVVEGYEWSMYKHIQLSTLYKSGQLLTGKDDNKPVKNIIRPIMNVQYRSEGFDVKDIELFVNDEKAYYKSLLARKWYSRWARKNELDTFIDDMVESYCDYGAALCKKVKGIPTVVPLQRIAFCDQTNLLSGVICEKHPYSPAELTDMASSHWDAGKIDLAITMAKPEKKIDQANDGTTSKTPGKYIEVYELQGYCPETWLNKEGETSGNPDKYTLQTHVMTYYRDAKNVKHGICLYKGKGIPDLYKAVIRDKIFGRALGIGGIEELFEAQAWTTFSMIQIKEMLEVATAIIIQTADQAFKNSNKITDMPKGKLVTHKPDMPLSQVQIQVPNMAAFERFMGEWEVNAEKVGAALPAQQGVTPPSGTPFKLQDLVVTEGQGIHEYRRGKISTFLDIMHMDWIIPDLVDDISKGDKWLDDLSLSEMQFVVGQVVDYENTRKVARDLAEGHVTTPEEQAAYKLQIKSDFLKGGSKKFMEILAGEMEDAPLAVKTNIAGKQKDLIAVATKLSNLFRQIFANPTILQNPGMAQIFNQILEASGFSPADFSGIELLAPGPVVQPDNVAPVVFPLQKENLQVTQ